MRIVNKTAEIVTAKAIAASDAPGTFEALISVFGNVDSDGDVVTPGAFTKTLADGPKPIVWSHAWGTPPIGETLEAKETDQGLLVKGRLFVADDEDHAVARQVYAGLKAGALKEFSWGGRVTKETRVEDENGDVTFELAEIDLVEYGPCLKGANPATALLAVKSLVKEGAITPDQAREALGVVKSDDPALPPLGDISDTNGEDVDTDGPQDITPADWDSTLAAVRAGVLTTGEARQRLGLPVMTAEPLPAATEASDHAQLLAQLDVAA